jgi:hypothetical protein
MHCGENQAAEQQSKSAFHWKPPELNVALTARALVLACLAMSGGRKIVNEIDDSDNSPRSMYRSAAHTNRTSQIRHITSRYLLNHYNVLDELMRPLSGRDTIGCIVAKTKPNSSKLNVHLFKNRPNRMSR